MFYQKYNQRKNILKKSVYAIKEEFDTIHKKLVRNKKN